MPTIISIASAPSLSVQEQRALRAVVALMIPAGAEYGVPGADDDRIFGDILASLGRDFDTVRRVLARIGELAGGEFADLPAERQRAVAQAFSVERSPGMEPRPPYPQGFEVEDGDWSLLEPVRARGKIYRDVP